MDDVLQKSAAQYEPRGRLDPAGFARHVQFQTYPPPEDLAPLVEHFWSIRWEDKDKPYHSEEVMHRPYVDLFFSAQESGIQGTFRGKRIYVAVASGRIIGCRFWPGAFHAFYDGPLAALQDRVAEVQQVFPQVDRHYVEHLMALDDRAAITALITLLRAKDPQPDPQIALINTIIVAVETDESLTTVAAVAAAFGKSERWLQQLFREYLGVGLKWLLKRQMLLRAAQQIRETAEPRWAALAYDLGYSSQQHFITAFKDVLGKTPVQYKEGLTDQS
jgi:AraC-like DNA-binding protein